MVPSCMSSSRLGTTTEMVGRLLKLVGKLLNGLLSPDGTLGKSVQGACFRTYSPDTHTSDPIEGKPSAYPVNVFFAAINSLPKFDAENVCGQDSSMMPCVEPETNARQLGWLGWVRAYAVLNKAACLDCPVVYAA